MASLPPGLVKVAHRLAFEAQNPHALVMSGPSSPSSVRQGDKPPNIGLFVTCLVDLMRPVVGFATVKLLEDAGCRVTVPEAQTCCGQPAYNGGERVDAVAIARDVIRNFEGFDYVVAPSGSCAAMIRVHYPKLMDEDKAGDPVWAERARSMAGRTFELTEFLSDVLEFTDSKAKFDGEIAYHDGCSGLRELGIREQPRALLGHVDGLTVSDWGQTEACCGFGGTFCVKYPEISERILDAKIDGLIDGSQGLVLGGDLGCLLNLAGRLHRRGSNVAVRHIAEVLAHMTSMPPIGGYGGSGEG